MALKMAIILTTSCYNSCLSDAAAVSVYTSDGIWCEKRTVCLNDVNGFHPTHFNQEDGGGRFLQNCYVVEEYRISSDM
jgi:hypothetical protein